MWCWFRCPCRTDDPPMADALHSSRCSYRRSSSADWACWEVWRCRSSDSDDCADESSTCRLSANDMEYLTAASGSAVSSSDSSEKFARRRALCLQRVEAMKLSCVSIKWILIEFHMDEFHVWCDSTLVNDTDCRKSFILWTVSRQQARECVWKDF